MQGKQSQPTIAPDSRGAGTVCPRYRGIPAKRGWANARNILALVAASLGLHLRSYGEIVSGPDIIAAPANVADCAAGGASNTHQQGFNEKQSVVLAAAIEVDPGGVFIPAGTRVDAQMLFYCTGSTATTSDLGEVWTFDGPILGVMSDYGGTLENASNGVLGASGTTYPGAFTFRGLEPGAYADSYAVSGKSITVNMNVSSPGDWIRVVTAARDQGVTFCIDYGSPSITPAAAANIYTVGSTLGSGLHPASTAPGAPRMMISGAALGIAPGGGHAGCPGPTMRLMDALSYGRDSGSGFRFSVDEWSQGVYGGVAPDVWSEGAHAALLPYYAAGNHEAAADVFTYVAGGNLAYIDGNGVAPFGGLGLGLAEPNPTNVAWQDSADNLNDFDLDTRSSDLAGPIYFSLGGVPSVNDPYENDNPAGCWNNCAAVNGFSGADILRVAAVGAAITVYASAATLGLDPLQDDVCSLALYDNGDGVFDPAVDRLYFSVRRNSAIIGTPDPCSGLSIQACDILTVPGAGCGAAPQIVVSYISLRLSIETDEIDGLDTFTPVVVADMNCDGVVNNFDIDNFVLALTDPLGYARANPDCDIMLADVNRDGSVNNFDIDQFVFCLTHGGCQ